MSDSGTAVALSVAGLAVVGSVATTIMTLRGQSTSLQRQLAANSELNRKQEFATLTSTALGYFTGKSQPRSVGIAALRIVRTYSDQWPACQGAIRDLLQKQLIYLLVHGENRWEAHEVANIEDMGDWLLLSGDFDPLSETRQQDLAAAVDQYERDAPDPPSNAVSGLLWAFKTWRPKLAR